MKHFLSSAILLATLFSSVSSKAQELPKNAIQFTGGYSKHGSGDMNGIIFGAEYSRYKTKKFSLNYYLRGSINNQKHAIIVEQPNGTFNDQSIRFTTAGVQLGLNGRCSFLRTKQHELLLSLGGFGRYQSASNGSDGYSLYGPQATGIPSVLVEYNNKTAQETYALGGLVQLQYNFTTKKNFMIGITPGFQTDTNGDAIFQVGLIFGKRF